MKTVLVIVAHPDDETIWMGGTILKNSSWKYTILSLCRKTDPDRAPKFKDVCDFYRADSIMADLDDEYLNEVSVEEVKNKILSVLSEDKFDLIFTHGKNGEYGHLRHKDVHNAVVSLVNESSLTCGTLYFFDYVPGKEKAPHDAEIKIPIPNKQADWIVKLTPQEHKKKLKIVTEMYGFKHPIIETLACAKEESFKRFN